MTARKLPFDPIERATEHWQDQGWEAYAGGMAAVTSVMRGQQIYLARANDLLRPLDLTFSGFEVLALLAFSRRGSLPLGKVSERLQVNAGTVTSSINRLALRGLVQRVPNPADGRGVLAQLTTEGRAVMKKAARLLNEGLFVCTGLDEQDQAQLVRLLAGVRRWSGDFGEGQSSG